MPDYSKGKIYKMLNTIDDEIYVGSTIETLRQRMATHRGQVLRIQTLIVDYTNIYSIWA